MEIPSDDAPPAGSQSSNKRRCPVTTSPGPKRRARPLRSTSSTTPEEAGPVSNDSEFDPDDPDDSEHITSRLRSVNDELRRENDEKWKRELEAELDRRDGLTPTARLKEDGEELLRQLERDKNMIILQETPLSYNGGARCRAGADCVVKRSVEASLRRHGRHRRLWHDPVKIRDAYRIYIDQSTGDLYYHVACFETMVNLSPLVPDRFFMDFSPYKGHLDSLPGWGLMFRKWFQHRGSIDLGIIAEYIKAEIARDEKLGDDIRRWQENHMDRKCVERFGLGAECDCPPMPDPPARPILRDYTTTADDGCKLFDVLHHRYCEKMKQSWLVRRDVSGVQVKMEFPENEPQSGDNEGTTTQAQEPLQQPCPSVPS